MVVTFCFSLVSLLEDGLLEALRGSKADGHCHKCSSQVFVLSSSKVFLRQTRVPVLIFLNGKQLRTAAAEQLNYFPCTADLCQKQSPSPC